MSLPTLDELKMQCRIDSDEEDELLNTYASAAKSRAENYMCRMLYEKTVPDSDPDGLLVSDDIKLAIMLAVGFWFENRTPAVLPQGFFLLLQPYRFIPL